MISELKVHMLQMESRNLLLENYRDHVTKNGLAVAVKLDQPISIDKVADASYMSKSSFTAILKMNLG